MEQIFNLKYHGDFNLFEIANLTGEERKWFMERINRQIERENKAQNGQSSGGSAPSMPSKPRMPSMPSMKK